MTHGKISTLDILALGVGATLLLLLGIVSAIVYVKFTRARTEALERETRAALTEGLIDVTESADPFEAAGNRVRLGGKLYWIPPPGGARGRATRETLLSMVATVKGEGRHRLVSILEEAGYVERAIGMLRSSSKLARVRGCMILGAMYSTRAVDPLIDRFLNDPDTGVRVSAAEALGAINYFPTIAALIAAMRDGTRWQRLRTANVVSLLGEAAAPALLATLGDNDDEVVTLALSVLSEIRRLPRLTEVLAALDHRSPEVRARAIEVLGTFGAVDEVDRVLHASRDAVWFVRVRAVKALRQLGVPSDPAVTSRYYNRLCEMLEDEEWWVRQHAAARLADSGERGQSLLAASHSDAAAGALQLHDLRSGSDHAPL